MEKVVDAGMAQILFESDSLLAVNELLKGSNNFSRFSSIIFYIIELSKDLICSFLYVSREANGISSQSYEICLRV